MTNINGIRFVPKLMSTPMVIGIKNSTKTETRRVIKFPKDYDGQQVFDNGDLGVKYTSDLCDGELKRLAPEVEVGDIIWVRETFNVNHKNDGFIYKADFENPAKNKNFWKPSLFMPKSACRLFLKCTSSQAERLQDIDEEGAINEGIENLSSEKFNCKLFRNYLRSEDEVNYQDFTTDCPIYSFQTLWQKINKKEHTWYENPWVWVYKFEMVERPDGFC